MKLSNKKTCAYVNNNTDYTKKIPQHLQRLMIEKFCKEKKIILDTHILEYNNMNYLPILFYLLNSKRFVNIVLFSIYSINVNPELIKKFILKAKKNNIKIYFANEFLKLSDNKTKKILNYLINK
tara:strand:- start:1033 stop:1404 length:372 start_codon:yes stop_codon:yes gene_type:complete